VIGNRNFHFTIDGRKDSNVGTSQVSCKILLVDPSDIEKLTLSFAVGL
jgi:hypothetical protein